METCGVALWPDQPSLLPTEALGLVTVPTTQLQVDRDVGKVSGQHLKSEGGLSL